MSKRVSRVFTISINLSVWTTKRLKECWLNEEEIPIAAYVIKFKYRLQTAISLAHNHLGKAQTRMKEHFDKIILK